MSWSAAAWTAAAGSWASPGHHRLRTADLFAPGRVNGDCLRRGRCGLVLAPPVDGGWHQDH